MNKIMDEKMAKDMAQDPGEITKRKKTKKK